MDRSRTVRRAVLILGAVALPVALAFMTSMIVRVSEPANAGILPAITTTTSGQTVLATQKPGAGPTNTGSPTGGAPASPGGQFSGGTQQPTTRPTDDRGGSGHSGSDSGGGGGSNDGSDDSRHGGGDD